jgi:hypothetical protein
MANDENIILFPDELIMNKIYLIREKQVMLDADLAELYAVETKQLKRAVRRNINRFPEDFMFELTAIEFKNLRCQIGTSHWDSIRYAPMAFTEHGVIMLASILNSNRAINVNIRIIRIYNRLRETLKGNKLIWDKLEEMQSTLGKHENSILAISSSPQMNPRSFRSGDFLLVLRICISEACVG